jgi:hypothetical protein
MTLNKRQENAVEAPVLTAVTSCARSADQNATIRRGHRGGDRGDPRRPAVAAARHLTIAPRVCRCKHSAARAHGTHRPNVVRELPDRHRGTNGRSAGRRSGRMGPGRRSAPQPAAPSVVVKTTARRAAPSRSSDVGATNARGVSGGGCSGARDARTEAVTGRFACLARSPISRRKSPE